MSQRKYSTGLYGGVWILLIISLCIGLAPVSGEKTPTHITLTITPEHPSIGMPYTITGTLTADDGDPLGNKKVGLEATSYDPGDESSYAFIAMDDTDRAGMFSFFRPMVNGERAVRVEFYGNAKYDGALSDVAVVDESPLPAGKGTGKTGSVMVKSDPNGATVYVDGNLSGVTPTTLSLLPEGAHELILSKEGYQNETVEVFVVAGETASASTSLNPVWIGFTKSGSTATLKTKNDRTIPVSDPVFTYSQNNLDLRVYRNASSSSSPEVTTIYSRDPFQKGYSLSLLITDKN